jgi:hypothetical protein
MTLVKDIMKNHENYNIILTYSDGRQVKAENITENHPLYKAVPYSISSKKNENGEFICTALLEGQRYAPLAN